MSPRTLAAAVLALSLLPLAAAAQAEPDTVRLRFGWEPGMRAEVEYERVRAICTGVIDCVLGRVAYDLSVPPLIKVEAGRSEN